MILFNSAELFLKDLISKINDSVNTSVVSLASLNLGENYKQFIEDIYKKGPIPQGALRDKQNFVVSNGRSLKVYILCVDFKSVTSVYHEKKEKYVYTEVEELKRLIRAEFKNRVPNYFHDILIHSPDCEEESEYINKLLIEYRQKCNFKEKIFNYELSCE